MFFSFSVTDRGPCSQMFQQKDLFQGAMIHVARLIPILPFLKFSVGKTSATREKCSPGAAECD